MNMAAKGDIAAMRLATTTVSKIVAEEDKSRHNFLIGWVDLTEKFSRSKANLGSLEHFNAMHNYFMFKKDIRRIEGVDTWIYEDDEPITEEDWHYFDKLHNYLRNNSDVIVPWPQKYPSEIEAEKHCGEMELEEGNNSLD